MDEQKYKQVVARTRALIAGSLHKLSITWPTNTVSFESVREDRLETGENRFPLYRLTMKYINGETGRQENTTTLHMASHRLGPREEVELVESYVTKRMFAPDRWSEDNLSIEEDGGRFLTASIQFVGWETWVIGWFNHSTRNTHLSDADLRVSFGRFVSRKTPAQARLNRIIDLGRWEPGELYCLMGAGARWRWKDPCRCQHCTAQGVVRIDH